MANKEHESKMDDKALDGSSDVNWMDKIESLLMHLEQSNQTLHEEVYNRIKWSDPSS
ncbi:hypothetical protein HC752_04685 [Vibrio sp. S9_S30]|uniref:hypothetical protein n=1 Tax=Vibrio sp. S9_S30 TaxID=2720226 RepID=UPI0016817BDA|nr:hypothetical protein [Vibrio sp. S9_S30]MBD1556225.1 hypothetical protein [Vibrio sp. S9_S30]